MPQAESLFSNNDCCLDLKNFLRYDWIALLDVDEVIVPRKHNSWREMMEKVKIYQKDKSSSSSPQGWP